MKRSRGQEVKQLRGQAVKRSYRTTDGTDGTEAEGIKSRSLD